MFNLGTIKIAERVRAQERLLDLQSEFAHAARISVLGKLTASIADTLSMANS